MSVGVLREGVSMHAECVPSGSRARVDGDLHGTCDPCPIGVNQIVPVGRRYEPEEIVCGYHARSWLGMNELIIFLAERTYIFTAGYFFVFAKTSDRKSER